MDPASGARRSRKLFSWRSTRPETRRVDQQTPTTDKQAVTVSVSHGSDSTCRSYYTLCERDSDIAPHRRASSNFSSHEPTTPDY